MFTHKIVREIEMSEGRKYTFIFPGDAPKGEAHDALCIAKGEIAQQIIQEQEQEPSLQEKIKDDKEKVDKKCKKEGE